MKKTIRHLRIAAVALASLAAGAATGWSAVVPNPQQGDIFIGFRASGGDGGSTSYLINLGSSLQFRNATPGSSFSLNSIGNIFNDLVAIYGEDWNTRADLSWGVFGHATSASPSVYASRQRTDINTPAAAWATLSLSALNNVDSQIGAVIDNINGYRGRDATANSPVAAIQPNFAGSASYNQQVATPGVTDFGSLSQWESIEGSFANGTGGTALDFFRLTAGGVSNLGAFSINDNGIITFTAAAAVPEPSTYALILAAAGIAIVSTRMRKRSAVNS
jgi:hypothetical protein